jgi:ribosome-binding protein aMBF1 (putative translation factor)
MIRVRTSLDRNRRSGGVAGAHEWYPKTLFEWVLIAHRAFSSLSRMARSAIDSGENLAMGRRVKDARRRIGLSQQRLAAMIDTSQSCISLWENGVNGASVACFFQLADALQVDARWLATGS